MVEPGIEPWTSWLVVRSSDHQATRLVCNKAFMMVHYVPYKAVHRMLQENYAVLLETVA